jgi:hypothetical protein
MFLIITIPGVWLMSDPIPWCGVLLSANQLPLSALFLAEYAARIRLNLVVDSIDGRTRSPEQLCADREARGAFVRSPRWHAEFMPHVQRRAWQRRRVFVCIRRSLDAMNETSMLLLADALMRSSLDSGSGVDLTAEAAHSADLSGVTIPDADSVDSSPASLAIARSESSSQDMTGSSSSIAALAISSFLRDAPNDVFRAVMSFV